VGRFPETVRCEARATRIVGSAACRLGLAVAFSLGFAHAATLRCGVTIEAIDWTKQDRHGDLQVFEVEICRAVAAARSDALKIITSLTETDALAALHSGYIALAVGVTPDTTREAAGIHFGPTIFYDSQAIMVAPGTYIAALSDLSGHTVCSIDGSDSELLASAALAAHHVHAIEFPFQEEGEMESGLVSHHCQAVAATVSRLANIRAGYSVLAGAQILPERLGLVPLASAATDTQFARVTEWCVNALLQAEQLGITQANAAGWQDTGNIEAERLMGTDSTAARALSLSPYWARRMIEAVGNYGEIYERTIGKPLGLPRGINALWNAGGVMAPTPVQ
jgi:general L-amino acid transport system substrate-binding protein